MSHELENLLNSDSVGIDKDRFLVDQIALIAAMQRTNRILLLRLLSDAEKTEIDVLLDEAITYDKRHLNQIMNDSDKFVR